MIALLDFLSTAPIPQKKETFEIIKERLQNVSII